MDVTVDKVTGKITVRCVKYAHDCGLIVNPDGLRSVPFTAKKVAGRLAAL